MYNRNQHVHFVGVGGVGMAGIAEVLLTLGYAVSGSDIKANLLTENLNRLGAQIAIGAHREENLPAHTSVVVVSTAVQSDNPELMLAQKLSIPIIPRAEMLAELMRMKYGIAIAGSHGKTTTTSLTAKVLTDGGLDPTVIIGGRVLSHSSGANLGSGEYLIAEADESDGSFCLLRPAIAVVTNIDHEHLAHYGSFGALEQAFASFMSTVPFYGLVVACGDDPVVRRVAQGLKRRVVYYGLSPDNKITASDIELDGRISRFTLVVDGQPAVRIALPLLGTHMISNALAACAVGLELGVYPAECGEALALFPGVARRCEIVGEAHGIVIADDYAHHPREISATLRAMRQGLLMDLMRRTGEDTPGKLVVIFQPHRFSRTRELFTEFLSCFGDADELWITDIYSAGEADDPSVSGRTLAGSVQHQNVNYLENWKIASDRILPSLRPGDLLVTLGAGNITQLGRELAPLLQGVAFADLPQVASPGGERISDAATSSSRPHRYLQ